MFSNFKPVTPISFGFGALLIIIFSVFFITIDRIQSLSFLVNELYEHPLEVSNAVMKIEGAMLRINKITERMVLTGTVNELEKDVAAINKYDKVIDEDFTLVVERFLGEKKISLTAVERFQAWRAVRMEIIKCLREGKREKAKEMLNSSDYSQQIIQIDETMMSIYTFARNKAESFRKDAIEIRNKTLKIVYTVLIIVLCVGAFFMNLLLRAEIKSRWSVEAIRQSEEKFHKFFDNAPSYCYIISPDGKIFDINNAAVDALGYTKDELLGKPFLTTIYAPASIAKAEKLFKIWQETGRLVNEEIRIVTKNGEERTVLLSADAIRDADGRLMYSISVQRDITLRKKEEDVLKEHSELLEKLVDKHTAALMKSENSLSEAQRIAHLGNWEWDIVNNELHWSDEIYRIFGREPGQFRATYEAFLACVHPDDRAMVGKSVTNAQEEHKPYGMDHRIVLPDGTIRIVHEQGEVFRNDSGKAVRMVGTVQDVTRRKHGEELLQINYDIQKVINSVLLFSLEDMSLEEIFSRTLELILSVRLFVFESKACVFIVDEKSSMLRLSAHKGFEPQAVKACENVPFGVCICGRAAQLRELQFTDRVDDHHHEIVHEGVRDHGHYCVPILYGGRTLGVINIFLKKGHKNEQREKEFLNVIGNTLANIIVRKRAEKEKVKFEKQLGYEQKMKILGHLTSGIAHEVRNPLNAIIAITEALFKDIGDNPEYQPYLEHIRNQVNRLSVLMQDILELGRPVLQTDLREASIGSLVAGIIASWQQSTTHKRHGIRMAEPSEAWLLQVKVDGAKMQQVFYNLFDNACEQSPADREIGVVIEQSPDGSVIIKVRDAGRGIAPQHLPFIFDPFFTTRKKGTGLGLSIVKNIIELHGGSIRLYNNDPDPGATAEISLPFFNPT